jgi:hypothetical protein
MLTEDTIKQYSTYDTNVLAEVLQPYIDYLRNLDMTPDVELKGYGFQGIADLIGSDNIAEIKCSKYPFSDYAWIQMMYYSILYDNNPATYHIINPLKGTISSLEIAIPDNIKDELLYGLN